MADLRGDLVIQLSQRERDYAEAQERQRAEIERIRLQVVAIKRLIKALDDDAAVLGPVLQAFTDAGVTIKVAPPDPRRRE